LSPRRAAPKPRPPRRARLAWALAPWLALGVMLSLWPRDDPDGMQAQALEQFEPGRGRDAASPSDIPPAGWKDILWRTWHEFNQDQILSVAASASFFGLLALFPGMAAFVSLYGLFADVGDAHKHLSALAGVLPADSLTFIGEEMVRIASAKSSSLSMTFVVSLLLSLWSANAGVKALFSGLNVAYEETEKRSFVKLNLVGLLFTVLMLVFLIVAMIATVAIPVVLDFLRLDPQSRLLALLRWPALLVIVMGGLSVLYRYGPSREQPRWRWVTWGSTLAAFGWLAVSLLFSWYVGAFAHYDRTYGSLGAVVGFMTWMWLSVTVILLGGELNSEMEHQTVVDSTTGQPLPMGLRGAHMADTLGRAAPGGRKTAAETFVKRLLKPAGRKDAANGPAKSDRERPDRA
jgi:membrane protein